jgi:hypothetical protein
MSIFIDLLSEIYSISSMYINKTVVGKTNITILTALSEYFLFINQLKCLQQFLIDEREQLWQSIRSPVQLFFSVLWLLIHC